MSKSIQQQEPGHAEIAQLAYEFWEKSGPPGNREVEFWLQAEQMLRARAVPAAAAPARPAQPAPARNTRPAVKSQPRQVDRRLMTTAA